MGAITPSLVVDLETSLTTVVESEFDRIRQNMWWDKITEVRSSSSRKEIVTWLLSTAQIRARGQGGNIAFDDLVSQYQEIENVDFGAGLKLSKQQLTDTDGGGLDLAAQWSRDIAAKMAYHPQERVTHLLKNGHTAAQYTAYDGVAFFSASHPVNPYNTDLGNYSNLITGKGISTAVSVDVALENLSDVISTIAGIKMPDGKTPRYLRPEHILVSPKLMPRAAQLTQAKVLPQDATSGSGGADVTPIQAYMGLGTPIQVDELFGFESDTTYFLACRSAAGSVMRGAIYQEREPFAISMYGEMTDAELSRKDEFEWHCKGRNAVSGGHPYMLIKVTA